MIIIVMIMIIIMINVYSAKSTLLSAQGVCRNNEELTRNVFT